MQQQWKHFTYLAVKPACSNIGRPSEETVGWITRKVEQGRVE